MEAEKKKAEKETKKWSLRESLLADILPAIESAKAEEKSCFAERLEILLYANADLRTKIIKNRANPLIAQRKIVASIPQSGRSVVKTFIRELLTKGRV